MANFIAICSKNGQRVELSLSRPTLEEAKQELHNQGFAIIEIQEDAWIAIKPEDASLSTFYFEIEIDWRRKNGQIKSSDSFRAYIKLVDDLHYQVISLCDNPTASEEEKKFFTNRIREMYAVFKDRGPKEKPQSQKEASVPKGPDADPAAHDPTSVLARQVAKYHALIEKIVVKIEFLLARYSEQLWEDRTFRLKELTTQLKQLKNITNPDKLKIVGETALDRIGQLEIELIEKGFITEKKEALGQTNVLLREIGSRKRIILPEDDFVIQIKSFWKGFQENYLSKGVKNVSKAVSPESASGEFLYFKNVRELKAYEAKKSEINHELFRGFLKLKGEKKERLILKRKLVDQNIELLTNRIKNRSVSYVKLKRGASRYSESFFFLCRSLGDFFTYSIFVYALLYSIYLPTTSFFTQTEAPHRFIFGLAALSFVALCFKQVRNWTSFSVFSGIAFLFVSAIGVNF